MSESILKIEGLTKRFAGLTAVNNLSLDMKERSIHSLIGPNGSGKTTTINMITGVFKQTEGEIHIQDVSTESKKTFQIARLGVGRTFQNLKLYDSMSALENLMIGGHELATMSLWRGIFDLKGSRREEKLLKDRAEYILNYIGLSETAQEKVKNLPYGKRKMIEFGRALMCFPKLLILDEPAAGLNPSERKQFVDIILKTFHEGIDIFLVEHNMDVVMNISTTITVLNFGVKIAEGTPKEIQNNEQVIKAYLGDRFKPIDV